MELFFFFHLFFNLLSLEVIMGNQHSDRMMVIWLNI
jgi:hypothetical protein